MYTSFYNLDKKPFEKNPDPSFLWLGEKHKEAFAMLLYGILENKGFLLLTGDAGFGKTILVKALAQSLEKDIEWAVLADPRLERVDFYNAIAKGFGIEKPFTSKVQFLIHFSNFLHKADDENKKVLLLVDDCHLLSQEMLEELRLLSNIEKADAKLINIFFVGQPEFDDMLLQPQNRAVKQRLTLKHELVSLDIDETGDYIRHRLKVAGTEEELFSAEAVQVIYRFSRGIPSRINALCDHALLSGSAQSILTIDQVVIESCVHEMDLPVSSSQGNAEFFSDEESSPDHLNEKFIPQPIVEIPSFSGFNLENDNQHGWLKYGLGFLILFVVGGSFWFSASRHQESDQKIPVEIAKDSVAKSIIQVSSSPAVTMLEETRSGISAKKAAELKTEILKKAYGNSEGKEKTENLQTGETLAGVGGLAPGVQPPVKVADAAQMESMTGQKVSGQAEDSGQAVAQKDILSAGNRVADSGVLQYELSERVIVVPITESQSEKQEKPGVVPLSPLEPRKIILGLRPNSLKLTTAGLKELNSFVEKLKLYPRATVYVKGYVSAKSNSQENIKLSEDRALSVQKLMLEKGIEAEQVEMVGMGNQDPIASNNTSEGRRKNRRVEIIVINDGI